MSTFLVTGAAGFIGANFVKLLTAERPDAKIVVLDALTYCGNIKSIAAEIESGAIDFVHGDIADRDLVTALLELHKPQYIINFAAESHVDRSLEDSRPFVRTNVEGTLNLLDCANRQRREQLAAGQEPTLLKYVQVSTDEVYGDLDIDAPEGMALDDASALLLGRQATLYGTESFSEATPLHPSSPYSASKASADLLVMAFGHSFGLPVVVTRCSNNYGPYQYPEKLIPLMINNIVSGRPLPVYGQGLNVRDWIYVADHCRGVLAAALKGRPGQVYNFGGYSESRNIDLVQKLIDTVGKDAEIQYVTDRPGHDRRYAINASKAMTELGWRPTVSLAQGLQMTVDWYLANGAWLADITSGDYSTYYDKMYKNR